jgi:hypothetical protein
VSDDVKFMLGPLLALLPILVWELFLRPARSRRNIAVFLLTEVTLNHSAALRNQLYRSHRTGALPIVQNNRYLAYESLASQLGELPPDVLELVQRYYSVLRRVEVTTEKVRALKDGAEGRAPTPREAILLARGQTTIDRNNDTLLFFGDELRLKLHATAETSWFTDVPAFVSNDSLRSDVERHVARVLADDSNDDPRATA